MSIMFIFLFISQMINEADSVRQGLTFMVCLKRNFYSCNQPANLICRQIMDCMSLAPILF